jgi:hypothetical protein
MFSAILGCLLGEDWAEPRIAELQVTPDRCLLARLEGDVSFKTFIGAEADLIRTCTESPRSPAWMATRSATCSAASLRSRESGNEFLQTH